MSRLVSRAENWEKVYTAFNTVNFSAFDYNTVKQSILDYIKLTFPETFNDYIETSEFIAIVESFAYVAELLAYRFDLDAHENFLPAAQRKDSILRLAKLISYTADRQIPARGLVKITSVSTTENLIDANGINLANTPVRWNDATNTFWKDQFILIMNRVLQQVFGTVQASDRFQIDNVMFELYQLAINPLSTGIFSYNAVVNGQSTPMELVPVAYNTTDGITERRPYNNSNFSILYGQDGLGDFSDTTGFFCFTKQGTLQRFRNTFDGVTPNIHYDIPINNVNDTDIWINNVNASTGETLDIPALLPYKRSVTEGISGEWVQVDTAHAQNVIFNTNPRRNKYEVETRDNNAVRIIFGDGEFADIPSGTFDFWVRTSLDADLLISQSAVVDVPASFTYTDLYGRIQTFSFAFSLIDSLQNGSAAETLEHIRTSAPSVYYSQDRMVNGQDYNSFMLQDSSILKLRAINRTFAGDSKYIAWHDPSTTYENVKMFGSDGALFFQDETVGTTTPQLSTITTLISTYVEPLLSSTDIFVYISSFGVLPQNYRRTFNSDEITRLVTGLTPPPSPSNIELYYNTVSFEWYVVQTSDNPATALAAYGWPAAFITTPLITIEQAQNNNIYTVNRLAKRLIFQSNTTQFWNTNDADSIIDYNTLTSSQDKIVVLQANTNYNRDGILIENVNFNVLGLENYAFGDNIGLPDTTRVSILPEDVNGDGVPDNMSLEDIITHLGLSDIIKPKLTIDLTQQPAPLPVVGIPVILPIYYIVGQGDIAITTSTGATVVAGVDWQEDVTSTTGISNVITLHGDVLANTLVYIFVNDYVYFTRIETTDNWTIVPSTPDAISSYLIAPTTLGLWKRELGRSELNFAWYHYAPQYHLIDPAASNIIDVFVIQKGYFLALKQWLSSPLATQPRAPTPLDLRLSYNYLLSNGMISDTVVLHPGVIKLLFGSKAALPLQANFVVVRSQDTSLTDNEIKTTIVTTIRNFFDVTVWEYGETFYFTELSAAIHAALPIEISTVLLVPVSSQNYFGDLFQIQAREHELFYPDITVDNITLVSDLNSTVLRMAQPTTCPVATTTTTVTLDNEYAFNFSQSTATTSWVITHELGFYPIVRTFDLLGNEITPDQILHPSVLQTIVVFATPQNGTARLV